MQGKRIPWWLWLNVLSLDAPVVALIWHGALAKSAGVQVSIVTASLLGIAVWIIYVADRLLDVRSGPRPTERHRFHEQHDRKFRFGLVLALLLGAALCLLADARLLIFGSIMVALSLAYGWFVHRGTCRLPKEILCGTVFSVGVVGPLFITPIPWLSVGLFGSLCTANCLVISYAEGEIDQKYRHAITGGLVALGLLGFATGSFLNALMGLSAIGLVLLHLNPGEPERKRVLADAALLTPLLGWLWL